MTQNISHLTSALGSYVIGRDDWRYIGVKSARIGIAKRYASSNLAASSLGLGTVSTVLLLLLHVAVVNQINSPPAASSFDADLNKYARQREEKEIPIPDPYVVPLVPDPRVVLKR
ncbi:hypothetical protein M8J76_001622 [Diaphorina citri]|nr:hypothetical protein M8J76_001622 [Diaphorina citri]